MVSPFFVMLGGDCEVCKGGDDVLVSREEWRAQREGASVIEGWLIITEAYKGQRRFCPVCHSLRKWELN